MAAAELSAESSLTDQTLDNTLGAILLGAVCASMLFGITTIQALWYYHSYKSDSRIHKFSVAIIWALDAFDLALVIEAVYTYVVHGFQNVGKLGEITWSIKLQVVVNVIVVLFVHSLYASRVWLLGGYHQGYLGYVVAITLIGGFGVGVILAYKVYTIGTYLDLQSVAWAINTALASQTATDFLITAAMCYYLSKSKGSITGFNMRISTVIQFTLSSGLLCTACSLATMFTYILSPNTFIFLGLEFLLTQFYAGSFIAMLNSRERPQSNSTSSFEGQTTSLPSWQRPMSMRPTSTICHMPEPPNSANSVEMLEAKGLPAESTLNLSSSRHSSYYHAY